jgi:hypothetical protein
MRWGVSAVRAELLTCGAAAGREQAESLGRLGPVGGTAGAAHPGPSHRRGSRRCGGLGRGGGAGRGRKGWLSRCAKLAEPTHWSKQARRLSAQGRWPARAARRAPGAADGRGPEARGDVMGGRPGRVRGGATGAGASQGRPVAGGACLLRGDAPPRLGAQQAPRSPCMAPLRAVGHPTCARRRQSPPPSRSTATWGAAAAGRGRVRRPAARAAASTRGPGAGGRGGGAAAASGQVKASLGVRAQAARGYRKSDERGLESPKRPVGSPEPPARPHLQLEDLGVRYHTARRGGDGVARPAAGAGVQLASLQ